MLLLQIRRASLTSTVRKSSVFLYIWCSRACLLTILRLDWCRYSMPWSPTQSFPHPLANIQPSNVDPSLKNLMSYPLVETIMWQGLGKVINRFRSEVLDLEPVDILWGQKGIANLQIPHTYCWFVSLPKMMLKIWHHSGLQHWYQSPMIGALTSLSLATTFFRLHQIIFLIHASKLFSGQELLQYTSDLDPL